MEKLTQKQAMEWHHRLWTWMGNGVGRVKKGWPEWEKNGGTVPACESDCPACEYDDQHGSGDLDCCDKGCLIKWDGKSCNRGEFGKWCQTPSGTPEETEICKVIANLPMNPNRGKGA